MALLKIGKYYRITLKKDKIIRHVLVKEEYAHMYVCETVPLEIYNLSTKPYNICINKNDLYCGYNRILNELSKDQAYDIPQNAEE